MTMTRNEEYMAAFTPGQLEFFYGFPVWVDAAWAIAVWGGVLGTILLLLRMGLAVWVLLASFLAMVVTAFHNYVLSNGLEVVGDTFPLVFTAIIFLVGLGVVFVCKGNAFQRRAEVKCSDPTPVVKGFSVFSGLHLAWAPIDRKLRIR